jgi:polyvinyl alcohol dehydrogenase (cytochrome)
MILASKMSFPLWCAVICGGWSAVHLVAQPKAATVEPIPQSAYCDAADAGSVTHSSSWNGYGLDDANSRFQHQGSSGISASQVPQLTLKWAFGFPGVTSSFGTPTIVGQRLYIGSADGFVYALNAISGCIYWTYRAAGGVRTGIVVSHNCETAYIGDLHGWMHAVSTQSGVHLWSVHLDNHPSASITGSPKLLHDRLIVPVSGGSEEVAAANPTYACCKFRGSLVALDAKTGRELWRRYTISDAARPTAIIGNGREMWGPSGASIWSSPTIDSARHAIYVGTGVNFSGPATNTSDAVLAVDSNTGKLLWSRQLLAGDIFNMSCTTEIKTNCPEDPGPNLDIGSSPILESLAHGRRILVVAAKSGIVVGIDPDHTGRILWQTRVSDGGPLGGLIWGGSSDNKAAYFAVSDWNPAVPTAGGGVVAIDIRTGKTMWATKAPKPTCLAVKGCSAAQPGATSLIPGAVFAGSLDGHLRAYDTSDGRIIWDFDTAHHLVTVDHVKAHGGSITGTGPSIAGGFIYVCAGYSRAPVMDGNVLLAFSVERR